MSKKILSILLAVWLVVGTASMAVFAAPPSNPDTPILEILGIEGHPNPPIKYQWVDKNGTPLSQSPIYNFTTLFDGDCAVDGTGKPTNMRYVTFEVRNKSNVEIDSMTIDLVGSTDYIYYDMSPATGSANPTNGKVTFKVQPDLANLTSAAEYIANMKIKIQPKNQPSPANPYTPIIAPITLKLDVKGPRTYDFRLQPSGNVSWTNVMHSELKNLSHTFNITNDGNSEDTYQLSITGADATRFELDSSSVTVKEGQSQQVKLKVKNPALVNAGQLYNATIQVKSNGSSPNIIKSFNVELQAEQQDDNFWATPNLIDFGTVLTSQMSLVSDRALVVENGNTLPHTFTVKLQNGSNFILGGTTSKSLAFSESFSATIKPKANLAPGTYEENITVTSDARGAEAKTYKVKIKVEQTNYDLSAAPPSIDFGSAKLENESDKVGNNRPAAETITITNTGQDVQKIEKVVFVTGSGKYEETFVKAILQVNQSMSFDIRPKDSLGLGTHDATLRVYSDKVPAGIPINVTFEVTAPSYSLQVDKPSLDFGSAEIQPDQEYVGTNAPPAQSVVLTNIGETKQSGLKAKFASGKTADYYLVKDLPTSINQGESITFTVQPGSAMKPGTYTDTLIIYTTKNPTGVPVDVTFTVTVPTDRHTLSANPNNVNFTAMDVEYGTETTGNKRPDSEEVKIKNTGPMEQTNLTVTWVSGSDKFDLTGSTTYPSLTPKGEFFFELQPKANLALGTHEAELKVQSSENPAGAITVKAFFTVNKGDKEGKTAPAIQVYDRKGEVLKDVDGGTFPNPFDIPGEVKLEAIAPNQTFYICLGTKSDDRITFLDKDGQATASQLVDTSQFKISTKKSGDGKSVVKSVTQESKSFTGERGSYLKIDLGEMKKTGEQTAEIDVTFKARKKSDDWESGESATMKIKLYITNKTVSGSDGSASTGESITFEPEPDTKNTLVFGDDRAAIVFNADEDADGFYARLSTKANEDIYKAYGDPAGADLWFYTFAGSSLPSTSRASVILGIPWTDEEEDMYDRNDMHIYQLIDRELYDVTSLFSYTEGEYEIDGWVTKTRTLGTYIVSSERLDVDAVGLPGSSSGGVQDIPSAVEKPVANTGKK